MDKIDIRYSERVRVVSNVRVVNYGKVEEVDDGWGVVKSIDEFTFYYLYCTINNVISSNRSLSDTQMLLLCSIMCKPLEFTLPVDSKDGKLAKIAEELSDDEVVRTANSIYQGVKKLKDKGYLIQNEDRLLVLCNELQVLRVGIKKQIMNGGYGVFDYLIKCVVHGKENE